MHIATSLNDRIFFRDHAHCAAIMNESGRLDMGYLLHSHDNEPALARVVPKWP
jgi:hypothetical protein